MNYTLERHIVLCVYGQRVLITEKIDCTTSESEFTIALTAVRDIVNKYSEDEYSVQVYTTKTEITSQPYVFKK